MPLNHFHDNGISTMFIQKTYGKLMLSLELLFIATLQFDAVAGHFYGQAACIVGGMVLIKLAHLVSQAGEGKAAQIEFAIEQRIRAKDAHRQEFDRVLQRATIALVVAISISYWFALKAIVASELRVRSIVKSVLCTVTDTITPKLFPCPPGTCA
jgi:hypothetical protein